MFLHRKRVHAGAAVLLAAISMQTGAATVGDPASVLTPPAAAALAADLEVRGLIADFYRPDQLLVGDGRSTWYYARVLADAMPAVEAAQPGIHRHSRAQPAGAFDYVLVFDDELGRRMQQTLAPASANWSALQAALAALPGVTEVSRDDDGDLAVVIDGRPVYGRLAPLATTTIAMWVNSETHLLWAGDLNRDGAGDYYVIYPPQSLLQILYVYPPRP